MFRFRVSAPLHVDGSECDQLVISEKSDKFLLIKVMKTFSHCLFDKLIIIINHMICLTFSLCSNVQIYKNT